MLLLTFQADGRCFGLDARSVKEIVPMVRTRRLPGAPECVAGVFEYRGGLVPVVDITSMISGRPTEALLSSRIILVHFDVEDAGELRFLGILAERVTGTEERDEKDFAPTGVDVPEVPYLDGISAGGKKMVQLVSLNDLLTDDLKKRLFAKKGAGRK